MYLDRDQFYILQRELRSICGIHQPLLHENGIFEIFNLTEYDAQMLQRKLKNCEFVEHTNISKSGFDYGKLNFSRGFPQPGNLYTLKGNVKFPDLDEDIEKHDKLNPKLFDSDNLLYKDVRDKLIEIAEYFIDTLKDDNIKFNLKDLRIVGSNCSYNYTKNSDIDLHLIADSTSLYCPDNLYPLLYSSYRSIFNKNYDPKINDIPVEIFVEMDTDENTDTRLISNGIYSVISNKWIKEPEIISIPDIDEDEFEDEFQKWEDRYNKVIDNPKLKLIDKLIEDLYDLRKESIKNEGEYGFGNLIFKEMRNLKYLDKLKELKNSLVSNKLSL